MSGAIDGDAAFHPTRWSLVSRAADRSHDATQTALEQLCRAYWYPLYAFLRRRGRPPQDAEDLVQGFFAELLEKGVLARADPTRGRFRTFLLSALLNHASHEREKGEAQKRGGGRIPVSLEGMEPEQLYVLEPADDATPEALYERRWALQTLDRALARTAEWARGGSGERAERYAALRPLLWGEGPPQAAVAASLRMSETALRVALHRLRAHLKDELRREVLETLADPADLDDELLRLAAALRPSRP